MKNIFHKFYIILLIFIGLNNQKNWAQTVNPIAGGLNYPVYAVCENDANELLALTIDSLSTYATCNARV